MGRRIKKQNILVRRPHIQSPAALYLLRRKLESIEYYLTWEKHRKEYLVTQELTCYYCKRTNLLLKSKDPKTLATIDHVVPRALGGKDEPSNYVVACQRCNEKKGAKPTYSRNPTAAVHLHESAARTSV